jgi:ABC-type sugar transport system ATPase subunit
VKSGNILETRGLSKSYPGVQALDGVDFDLGFGEVQALVGQNGAGKSTFIEIIAGSLRPDSGVILIGGQEFTALDPARSIELGVQTVHQDNQLVDELSVAENIYLYNLPRTGPGFVSQGKGVAASETLLGRLGIDVSPRKKMKELTFIERKLVSIAKAFSRSARILILDEPTASLDEKGRKILFNIIRRHTRQGLSVIYISHNLGEIFEVCDRVTVMVDGRKVDTSPVKDVTMNDVVHRMIGRSTTALYARRKKAGKTAVRKDVKKGAQGAQKVAPALLSVVDFHREGVVEHVSFEVRPGEIFGLGGLVGSGRTELARMIFGLDRKDSGRLLLRGTDITPDSPYDAIQKGVGFLTEDRKTTGLVLKRPVSENITHARFAKSTGLFMNLGQERADTEELSRKLDIKTPSVAQKVVNLSGGNQQKVVLGKWLHAESEVLIFDEPTVGIDIGAKTEIHRMMDDLARQGKAVIMISSDTPELVAVSDTVGVMRNGRLATTLSGKRITEENILRFALGVDEEEEKEGK